MKPAVLAALLTLGGMAGSGQAAPAAAPAAGRLGDIAWAFPVPPPPTGAPRSTARVIGLSGSTAVFSDAEIHDLFHAVDWRPKSHPAAPAIVLAGRPPDAMACGFCHLPGGQGRPENANIAGLPAAYIRQQLADMRSGAREGVQPAYRATALMHQVARGLTPAEAAQAADYFSRLPFTSRLRVIEAASIPHAEAAAGLYRFTPGPPTPLGHRIIEGPDSFERFELRDDRVGFFAYVPPGAISRGAALAAGDEHRPACASCHGKSLHGDVGPPLAGRSPSGLFRQLAAFSVGARAGPASGPMRDIAGKLSTDEMIDLAAYAGSLKP